jgi:hypothetical protein
MSPKTHNKGSSSFVRHLPQRNLYCELSKTSATEEPLLWTLRDICHRGTFIVSFEWHLPQRNLYCELWETSATEEPLLWALRFLCGRCLSKLTIKVPLWQMSLKAHNKGSSVADERETSATEEPLLWALSDICHRGTFIVSFERHLPQRNLYCELWETSATEEPLLWALRDICHRGTFIVSFERHCLSKLTIKVPLWQMSPKAHNKGSSVADVSQSSQ